MLYSLENRFISLVSDTTFKYLMKNDETRKWLLEIIKRKTGIDLSSYTLVDNEYNTGNKRKDYKMDLVFKKDDNVVIVEMNANNEFQSLKGRYYLYRVAGSRFDKGQNYRNTNTKLIMFNNYCNSTINNLNLANYTLNDKENNLEIEEIEIYEIYLPNYHKMCYDKCDEIEKRLWLFSCESYEEMNLVVTSKEDKAIIKELERLSMDYSFVHDYDHDKVDEMLTNTIISNEVEKATVQAHAEGLAEGQKETQISTAKELLKMNMPIEQIAIVTKLSVDEIKDLEQ